MTQISQMFWIVQWSGVGVLCLSEKICVICVICGRLTSASPVELSTDDADFADVLDSAMVWRLAFYAYPRICAICVICG